MLAAALPALSVAQEPVLEEVFVTATKRTVSAQSISESIVAFSGRDLEEAGIVDFATLTDSIAGVELRREQPGRGSISVRGVAEQNTANLYGGTGSAVGFYMDEAPLTMAGQFPDMASFDMERVEVLKGPQGTLYGEGSLAGTVRMLTNRPNTEEFSGSIMGTYSDTEEGSDNSNFNGMLNVPLIKDKLALRVVGSYADMSGFIDRTDPDTGELLDEEINSAETTFLRGSLLWQVTDNFEAKFTYSNSNLELDGRNLATDDLTNSASTLEPTDDETDMLNLTLRYDLGFGTLMSSTTSIERDIESVVDQSGLVDTVNDIFEIFGLPTVEGVFIDQLVEVDAFAQEFRFTSSLDGNLNYTLGAFYRDHDSRFFFQSDGVPSIDSEFWELISSIIIGTPISEGLLIDTDANNETWAIYGELTYDINPRTQLVVGGRYFEEDRESTTRYSGVFLPLSGGPLPGEAETEGDDNLFNPRVSLTYDLTEDVMVYGTYSEGFRSGGQNDLFVLVENGSPEYDSEDLTNYEIGMKSEWLDRRLRVNASLFYMDWQDLQVVEAEGPGGIGEIVGNVGNALTQGIDLEIKALPIEGLELTLSGALMEAEIDEDVLIPDPAGGDPVLVEDGTRIPRTSEESLSFTAQYEFPVGSGLTGFARGNYSYVGDAIDQLARQNEIDSYELVSARFGLRGESWSVAIFGDNLLDDEIRLAREPSADAFSGDTRWAWGRPRTLGATLRYDF